MHAEPGGASAATTVEPFWRSSRRAPPVTALGVAVVALVAQWVLPHSAYAVVTSTLFTRETWLHDDAWSAVFLFLAVVWWLGARATGLRTYGVLSLGMLWLGSYLVQAGTFMGLLMAVTSVPLDASGRARAADIAALSSVCLGVYAWLRTTLGRTIREAAPGASKSTRVYGLGLVAAVLAITTFAQVAPCGTVDCRAKALRAGVGDDVVRFVETYIRESPAIAQDVGAVQQIALRAGTRSHVDVWLDYDAELFVEVHGARGTGTLDLSLAGNSYRELSNSVGWWHAAGRRVPLDNGGAIDTIRLRTEATRVQERELEAARAQSDCAAVLAIIERNDDGDRRHTAFRFEQRDVSLWRAECAEKAGDRRHAADAYATYAFRLSPAGFDLRANDAEHARAAQRFLAKAIALDPESPNRRWWDSRMTILRAQERFAEAPKDHALCLELKQAFAEGRVHYANACP